MSSSVPAEGHLQHALSKQVSLFAAVDGSVEVDAILSVQGLQSLDVLGRVHGVLGVLSVGKGAAVHIVVQSAGALVTALSGAEHSANGLVTGIVQGLNSLQEVLGGPGVGLSVHILPCAGLLEDGLVDGHAVSGHAQGVLVVSATAIVTGSLNGSVDVSLGLVSPQVSQVDHLALGAPVGDQTLGSFHDDVGSGVALDGGVDLVVAISVGQVLDLDGDVGISGIELRQQLVDDLLLAPVANGVSPQADLHGSSLRSGGSSGFGGGGSRGGGRSRGLSLLHGAGAQRQHHDHSQCQSNQLFHCVSSCYDSDICFSAYAVSVVFRSGRFFCFVVIPTTSSSILQQVFNNVNNRLKLIFRKRTKMKIISILHRKPPSNTAQ